MIYADAKKKIFFGVPLPFIRFAFPVAKKKGQTTIEYALVMLALLFVFAMMYRSLQWYLSKQFKVAGVAIVRMYTETPF